MKPSTDYEAIARIFSDPRIIDALTDDYATDDIHIPEGFIYLLSEDKDGVVMVVPRNSIEYELHIAVLPEAKHRAFYYGKRALDWLFSNGCLKATVMVPFTNEQVYKYCLKMGFSTEGINRMSFLKNGKLNDQWFMGLTREGWLCRH